MLGSLDQPPIIVRASRARAVLLVIASAIFVAIGVLVLGSSGPEIRLFCIGFFSLCGVIGLGTLIMPPRLEIGPLGLKQTVLWRTTSFAWTAVYNFRAAIIGPSNKIVGFDYLNAPPKQAALRGLNAKLIGVQGALQPGWEMSPEALADLLNNARERWIATPADAPMSVSSGLPQPSMLAAVVGAA